MGRYAGRPVGAELVTLKTRNFVVLYRGPMHFSPDGEHCCVRTDTNERKCVTYSEWFVAIGIAMHAAIKFTY